MTSAYTHNTGGCNLKNLSCTGIDWDGCRSVTIKECVIFCIIFLFTFKMKEWCFFKVNGLGHSDLLLSMLMCNEGLSPNSLGM